MWQAIFFAKMILGPKSRSEQDSLLITIETLARCWKSPESATLNLEIYTFAVDAAGME